MEKVIYCTIELSVCKQLVAMGTKTISLFRFRQRLFGDKILSHEENKYKPSNLLT